MPRSMTNKPRLFTRLLPDGTKAQAPNVKVLHAVVNALWAAARVNTKRCA